MHGCTHSELTRPRQGFTVLEIVVLVAILVLIVLAVLPAIRGTNREQHFQLQPRATPATTSAPEPTQATAVPETTPAPATPKTHIR